MITKLNAFSGQKKLEYTAILAVALILYKSIFPFAANNYGIIISELLVLSTTIFIFHYLADFAQRKKDNPLGLVLNTGILTAFLFFLIAVVSSLFGEISNMADNSGILHTIYSNILTFAFIASITYILASFGVLYSLKKKSQSRSYFNWLLIILAITFLTNGLAIVNPSLEFIKQTFFILGIVVISFNSLSVGWIAFLNKKQKKYLLLTSILLSFLFGMNFAITFDTHAINQILFNYSPGLHLFISLIMLYGCIYMGVIFFTTLFHLPTAEAFDRKADEISSLIDLSKIVTQVNDQNELAKMLTSNILKICAADQGWLIKKYNGEWNVGAVQNIAYVAAEKITSDIFSNITFPNEIVLFSENKIPLANIDDSSIKGLSIVPLKMHNEINGYFFLGKQNYSGFDEDELKAIGAFADYAAVALENSRLFKESIEKERMESELNVAREIQYKLLPAKTPEHENLQISALFIPAFEVGGDYYDFFPISENKIGFIIADVSGKGISAAFIMAEVKGIFETLTRTLYEPRDVLIKANEILCESLERKNFVTAIYGVIDTQSGVIKFARAGHTPLLFCRNNNVTEYKPAGIGLGLDSSDKFADSIKEMEIELNNNDILILYTDGITEARNKNGIEFGLANFEKIVRCNEREDANSLSSNLIKEVSLFSKDNVQHDDITLVLFKWDFNNKALGDT